MIRWLGTKKVKLATIVLPGGFAKRKKEQHVRDLAASIERGGVISLPVVQDKPRKLVAGGDRLAALMLNKVMSHEVRIVRGTAQELEELMLEENLLRRRSDDYAAMTKRLVELRTGDIEAADRAEVVAEEAAGRAIIERFLEEAVDDGLLVAATANDEPAPVGRPKTAKGKAREQIAKETGKTPEAIRQAEKRAVAKERKAAEQEQNPFTDAGEPLAPPVETYGLPLLTAEDAYQVVMAQAALEKVEGFLNKALASVANHAGADSLAARICNDVMAALGKLAVDVRAAYPRAVCAACKLIPARRAKCKACASTGFVGVTEWLNAPDELRLGGDQAKVSDGKGGFIPYAREVAKEEKAAERKTERKLRVELDDGTVFEGGA